MKSRLLTLLIPLLCISSLTHAATFEKVPLDRHSGFIAALYNDLLGRAPQTSNVLAAKNLLTAGSSKAALATDIISSTEHRTLAVQDLYKTFLGRSAETAELDVFLGFLANGLSTEDIKREILASDEYFQSKGGGTNSSFIDTLFATLLGRSPSSTEATEFVRSIVSSNNIRLPAVQNILSSTEYRTIFVSQLYQRYLGRTPSSFEVFLFLVPLSSNFKEEVVHALILGSEEYFSINSAGYFKGTEFSGFLGSFDSPNPNFGASDFKATIHWGDGKKSQGEIKPAGTGFFAVFGTHAFKRSGNLRIKVVIKYDGGNIRGNTNLAIDTLLSSLFPFTGKKKKGVKVATGDVSGDTFDDVIVGAGVGSSHVRVFDGLAGTELKNFFAFDADFAGGVYVAAGDVNGDGKADIVTGAGAGGAPHVKVFSGEDLSLLRSFLAYDTAFTGGVQVAAADVNGDGKADVITGAGAGAGGGPHVKVFDGVNQQTLASFFAYDTSFTGGVFVAAGDLNGDGRADIVTSPGVGAGPQIKVFDGQSLGTLSSFFAYSPSFKGGVRVAVGDVNGDGTPEVITGPGKGISRVKAFNFTTSKPIKNLLAFQEDFTGGVFVAAGDLDGDGKAEIIVGEGAGSRPHVKVF